MVNYEYRNLKMAQLHAKIAVSVKISTFYVLSWPGCRQLQQRNIYKGHEENVKLLENIIYIVVS